MNACPSCKLNTLYSKADGSVNTMICIKCLGSFIPFRVLHHYVQDRHAVQISQNATAHGVQGKRACPCCSHLMKTIIQPNRIGKYELDVCLECICVWFDGNELKDAPHTPDIAAELAKMRQFDEKINIIAERYANGSIGHRGILGFGASDAELAGIFGGFLRW